MIKTPKNKKILSIGFSTILISACLFALPFRINAQGESLSYELVSGQTNFLLTENGQQLAQISFEEENPAIAFLSFDQKPYLAVYSPSLSPSSTPFFLPLSQTNITFWSFSGDFSSLFVSASINQPLPLQLESDSFIDYVELLSSSVQLQGLGRINSLVYIQGQAPYPWASYASYIQNGQTADLEDSFNTSLFEPLYNSWLLQKQSNQTLVSSIMLPQSTVYASVGEEVYLSPSISPPNASNQSIKLSSENRQVATISNSGAIQARQAGVSQITLSSADGGATTQCTFVVVDAHIQTENLFFVASSENDSVVQNIEAAILFPEGAETLWGSSNPSVASFMEKTTTGAAFAIHLNQSESVSATIELSVSIADVVIKDVIQVTVSSNPLLPSELIVHRASPKPLTFKGISKEESSHFSWNSSDPSIATFDPATGSVTAYAMGRTTITAITPDGQRSSCLVLVPGIKMITDNIALNKDSGQSPLSQTLQAEAVMPEGTPIQWISDNTSFVSLSSGISQYPETSATISLPQPSNQTAWVTALITVDGVSYSDSVAVSYHQ